MINILFVIIQMEMGGAEKLIHNITSKLDRNRFNPSIAYFFGEKAIREFRKLQIPLHHIEKNKKIDLSAFNRLNLVIKTENIHIVNAHHFMPFVYSFYGCKIKNDIKLIYTEHSEWEILNLSKKWTLIGKYLFARTDKIIGVNNAVTNMLSKKFHIPSEKALTINNGIDIKNFEKEYEIAQIKNELGIRAGVKIIGIVANFRRIKNHIFLLSAFAKIFSEYSNIHLLMVGQGFKNDPENTENDIIDFIVANNLKGHVSILGYRSDIPRLLSVLDVFCLTSNREGLPISMVEAMAAGKPIIGTNVEGIKNLIIDQKNGFLIENNNIEQLKEAILKILNSKELSQKFGYESKRLAYEKYSIEKCVGAYSDAFTSIT